MSESFEVIAITSGSERTIYCSPSKKEACKVSLNKNKKTSSLVYVVECLDGSRMTIVKQRQYLRDKEDYERRNDPLLKDEYYNDHPKKLRRVP